MNRKFWAGSAAVTAAAICGEVWRASIVLASDHDEAPLVKADAAMDLTDLFIFDSAPGKATIIVCWAGFNDSRLQPDAAPLFDADALYTIFVDNDDDQMPDHAIRWRYAQNEQDEWGVRWENVPGADARVAGPVETIFEVGPSARTWTGHADDPFFVDLQGYLQTLSTGNITFDNTRDFLAGFNVTAAAIEIDVSVLTVGDSPIQVWATASRK